MKTIGIAMRMLWKRRYANLLLVLEVLLSIIMLAQLFVYIADHQNSRRAVAELPVKDTIVLNTFFYYPPDDVMTKILSANSVQSVGRVYTGIGTAIIQEKQYTLAAYSAGMLSRYTPKLQSGVWLSDDLVVPNQSIPAVISADINLEVGDTAFATLTNGQRCQITVVGVLAQPNQYLYPTGGASPEYFSAGQIIGQEPILLLRGSDIDAVQNLEVQVPEMPTTLFVFTKPDENTHDLLTFLSKYGEVTPITTLIANYYRDTDAMIGGGIIMFIIFLFLSATCVLSNNVIQSMRNRRRFTVYYLLGMNWKTGAVIEAFRVLLLIAITTALTWFAGNFGLLMMEWMTPKRVAAFYSIVIMYTLLMFTIIGIGFLAKLMREDVSVSLKNLQQGE